MGTRVARPAKRTKLLGTGHWAALGAVVMLLIGAGVVIANPGLVGLGGDDPMAKTDTRPNSTLGGAATATAGVTPTFAGASLSLPLRAAFYEAGFPQAWSSGATPVPLAFQPSAGRYDGGSAAVVDRQIGDLQYAGLQAGIVNWPGQGSPADQHLPLLLQRAAAPKFHWAVAYGPEAAGDPTPDQIRSDLARLAAVTADPGYLHIGGRAVLFLDTAPADTCTTLDRWAGVDLTGYHVIAELVNGAAGCAHQPQNWYGFDPTVARNFQAGRSAAVSAGFAVAGQPVKLPRDPKRFRTDVSDMAATKAPVQLISSYNGWAHGTAVESAVQWASPSGRGAYLDVLHDVLALGHLATPTPSKKATPTDTTVTVAAVGDIACDPSDPNWRKGAGTSNNCHEHRVAALVGKLNPTVFLPLGDVQYENGTASAFAKSYHPAFGRYLSISRPVVGNHEYRTDGAAGYFDYFGSRAGPRGKGYYSYDLGAWHLIALNSECGEVSCSKGSAQETWLRQDLAAHSNKCVLAYWHVPRWSHGAEHGDSTSVSAFVQALYDAKAELILTGHDHGYERFAPRKASGEIDQAAGVREFVVGTGGKNLKKVSPGQATEASTDDAYGLLSLTLAPTSYSWRFLPEAGKSYSDSGTTSCH